MNYVILIESHPIIVEHDKNLDFLSDYRTATIYTRGIWFYFLPFFDKFQ